MHLLVATPSYSGTLVHEFANSLLRTWGDCLLHGIAMSFQCIPSVPFVDVARNAALGAFLKTECTHILFVDADLGWDPTAPRRMMQRDKDIIGGVYRFKQDDEGYPVLCLTDDGGFPLVEDGMIKATDLPGGFLLIKRGVIERMARDYPKYKVSAHGLGELEVPALFACELKGGQFHGEDFLFCKRARAAGYDIWIEPDIAFSHIGTKGFHGNYHEFMLRQPGGSEAKEAA